MTVFESWYTTRIWLSLGPANSQDATCPLLVGKCRWTPGPEDTDLALPIVSKSEANTPLGGEVAIGWSHKAPMRYMRGMHRVSFHPAECVLWSFQAFTLGL